MAPPDTPASKVKLYTVKNGDDGIEYRCIKVNDTKTWVPRSDVIRKLVKASRPAIYEYIHKNDV